MKKIMLLAAVLAAMMISCDKYDDGRPQKDVRNEFNSMYPDAFDVDWEWEGAYWIVSFETGSRPDGIEHEAIYDADGNWIQTKTEISIGNVPQFIRDFLTADPVYGSASLADNEADYIETPSGNFYRFSIRLDGITVEVDVNENGKVSLAAYLRL